MAAMLQSGDKTIFCRNIGWDSTNPYTRDDMLEEVLIDLAVVLRVFIDEGRDITLLNV
jgi:hypothetical protein